MNSLGVGLALLGCVTAALAQAPSVPRSSWPAWLLEQTTQYERHPSEQAPRAIWQLTHEGAPTYLVVAPCCDWFNKLYSFTGEVLCSPSGGFTGQGDGKCPHPADPQTTVRFVWAHPKLPKKQHIAPNLGQGEGPTDARWRNAR